jgi:arsenate reductase
VEPALRRFLEEPPTAAELAALVARLEVAPRDLARRDADEYQALRLSDRTPDDELLRALAQHPQILERPILVGPQGAIVARPAERALDLLADAAERPRRRVGDNPG